MWKKVDNPLERIKAYSREPEIFLSDLRQRNERALKLGSAVLHSLECQIYPGNDPRKASLLVRIVLECGSVDASSGSLDMREIDATLKPIERALDRYKLDDEFQEIIVNALNAGERLRDEYLGFFIRLARRAFSKASESIPVTALINLLHLAKQKIERAFDGYPFPFYLWGEVAETLLELGVQEAVEPILEQLEIDRCCCNRRTYTSVHGQLLRMINYRDPVTLKRFMTSEKEYVRRFILVAGCISETIWDEEESQNCLESVHSNDSDHTIRLMAAFLLARSGRKEFAPDLIESINDNKFIEQFSKFEFDKRDDVRSKCLYLLCSFREPKAIPFFRELLRPPERGHGRTVSDLANKLSTYLLENSNYLHFPEKEMAEILCILMEYAGIDYLDKLSNALIKLGNHQIIDKLERFASPDERRLMAAFKTLVGLNEAERLIDLLLNSEGLRASAVGKVLSSTIDQSVSVKGKILNAYGPQLPWSLRKALIIAVKGSRELLAGILEIEKDYELRQLIEETIPDYLKEPSPGASIDASQNSSIDELIRDLADAEYVQRPKGPVAYATDRAHAAKDQLINTGKDALPAVIKCLTGPGPYNQRAFAAQILGEIGDACAIESLVEALRDPEVTVRGFSAEALGKIGDARAVDPLLGVSRRPGENSTVKSFARGALQALGVSEIGDSHRDEQAQAIAGKDLVGKLSDEAVRESREAVEKLIDIVLDPNENMTVRRLAWESLEKVYYSTSDAFSEWADQRVMQRGARRPG